VASDRSDTSERERSRAKEGSLAGLPDQSGADFDRAYVEQVLSEQEKDIALFERQSTSGSDTELRAFAAKTLPKLRQHLDKAQSLDY
jgi:putative membrane protein